MGEDPNDGRCGVPLPCSYGDGLYLRCTYEPDHKGDHSWKKHERHFKVTGGVFRSDMIRWCHPKPEGCTCQPLRTDEGEIVEYVFSPDCVPHSKTPQPPSK
jgi:hypothetical protein